MEPTFPHLLALTLLGGFLALDGTGVGQFMLSRPLVAGTLAGWMLGDPAQGLLVGGVLELFYVAVIPVGGAHFPEAGPAAVVAAATAAHPGAGALPLGLAMGLLWGQIGGATVTLLRNANDRIAPDPDLGPLTPGSVVVRHVAAIGLDFVRGAAVTGAGILVSRTVVFAWADAWPLGAGVTLGGLLAAAAASLGILLRSFGGRARRRGLFLAGLAAGAVVGAFL